MRLLSWNIQSTQGCDGRFDLPRIAAVIKAFGELDVICLQEVSRNLDAYNGDDQKRGFEQVFAGYQSVWATGFSWPTREGRWQEFGNLTLVREGLLLNRRSHMLPCPYIGETPQLPRCISEAVIAYQGSSFTLLNTHLAFHSVRESQLQQDYIHRYCKQILERSQLNELLPIASRTGAYVAQPAGPEVLLCGDLNIALDSDAYRLLKLGGNWCDCFDAIEPEPAKRAPTCGVFDAQIWPEGPHTRDYFLSTQGLFQQVRQMQVNVQTDASDHQPVLLDLA